MPASAAGASMASSAGASVVASSAGASSAFSGEQAARARTPATAKTGLSLKMDFMVLFPFVAETRARVVSTPSGLWQDVFLALAREGHAALGPTPFPRTLGNPPYSRFAGVGKEDKILTAHVTFLAFGKLQRTGSRRSIAPPAPRIGPCRPAMNCAFYPYVNRGFNARQPARRRIAQLFCKLRCGRGHVRCRVRPQCDARADRISGLTSPHQLCERSSPLASAPSIL